MTTKLELEAAVSTAQTALNLAQQALEAFNDAPENNQFDDIEKAHSAIEDKLYGKAHKACEGSHCCGLPKYTQEFIVNRWQTCEGCQSPKYCRDGLGGCDRKEIAR